MESETIKLTAETVAAYKAIMENPVKFQMDFKPLSELFQRSEVATPKHILYKQYLEYTGKAFPKIMFYIIINEVYPQLTAIAPSGELGWRLTLNI